MRPLKIFLLTAALGFIAGVSSAEEFYCEVMALEGRVTLSNSEVTARELMEGDLLAVDDVVSTEVSSFVDIAYDRDWNNITRIEENSTVRVSALHPTTLGLDGGAVFSKLKSLPKDTAFNVETPTAIASVRGSEYRTAYVDGQTEVENAAESEVLVYGRDPLGQKLEPVVVRLAEKTHVKSRGARPEAPRRMRPDEMDRTVRLREKVDGVVQKNLRQGRLGRMNEPGAREKFLEQRTKMAEGRRPGEMPQRSGEGRRPDATRTNAGDDARGAPGPGLRSGEGYERPKPREASEPSGFVSGEGIPERRPKTEPGGDRPSGGIGEPYFPSGERQRSGGPEAPSGIPDERWKSGSEGDQNRPSPETRKGPPPRQEGGSQMGPSGGGGGNGGNKPQQKSQTQKPAARPRQR